MSFYAYAWIGAITSGIAITATKLLSKKSIKNPWLFNFVWLFFVLIFITPVAILNNASMPVFWLPVIVVGILQALFYGFYIFAVYRLDVSTIAPLFSFRTIFAVFLGILIFQEKFTVYQAILAAVIIFASIFATIDEKMNIKSFLNPSVGLALISTLMLALANTAVKWATTTDSVWTVTLWATIFTFIATLPTYVFFKKDISKTKKKQMSKIALISLLQVVITFSINSALKENVSISSIIISLPFSMILAVLFSFFAPKLLEKHTAKIYLIRFIAAGIMIYGAFLLSSSSKINSASANYIQSNGKNYYANARFIYLSPTPTITPTLTPVPTLPPREAATIPPLSGGYCLTVPILMYHHIQPQITASELGQTSLSVDNQVFDQQMAYLAASGYTAISAEQLINALNTKSGLPGKNIMITFDDGYKDIATYAFPVMQKYGLIGNIMVPTGLIENSDYLSWGDLKNMTGSGLMFAYDHTWSHASLTGVSNEKIQSEILTAKTQLEQNLGRTINIFAYPYGSENQNVRDILSQNGFIGAFSTIPGWIQCDSFIMSLHRNRVGNSSLSSYGL